MSRGRHFRQCDGGVLLAVIIIAMVLAVTTAGFMRLALTEYRVSHSAKQGNAALNLAESGVEFALDAINHGNWGQWTRSSGVEGEMQPRAIDLGAGVTGVIRVRIVGEEQQPTVYTEAVIDAPSRPKVTRQVRAELRRRSLFANGITTRRGVTFSGANALVNSYSSSQGPPSSSNVNDKGSVATTSVETGGIILSNATIFGWVSTGGPWPNVGPNGRIYGHDTPAGVRIDPGRVALDFAADFSTVTPPGSYDAYISEIHQSLTLGSPGASAPEVIRVDDISLSGNRHLTIQGPVVIHLTGDGRISGNASIQITESGSVIWYVDGDLTIAGNGILNHTNVPAQNLIFGTGLPGQEFSFSGNAALWAAIYAPNASVRLVGNATMGGAVVADEMTLTGNGSFHYDEDLADLLVGDSYRLQSWVELIRGEDRATFN